jgi:hypothetical protein
MLGWGVGLIPYGLGCLEEFTVKVGKKNAFKNT